MRVWYMVYCTHFERICSATAPKHRFFHTENSED